MTPEYLEQLADLADPQQLWRLGAFHQMELPMQLRHQLDMGVALRRHAAHIRCLRELLGTKQSLLITPIGVNHIATKTVPVPPDHERILCPSPSPRTAST